MKKLILPMLFAVLFASLLSACSEGGTKDPYATVTLREATRSSIVSKEFKYKLVNPEIVALNRNLGIIREGNLMEFIAARSLEDKLEGTTDGFFELNVVKKFSPFVHFKVERIATETDTIFPAAAGSIAYPKITTPAEYGITTYEEHNVDEIPYNNTGVLRGLKDKSVMLKGKIAIETEEGRSFFVIVGEKAKLRIADPSDGTGLILKMLAQNNNWFEGGVTMTEVESYSSRMKTRVAGTVEVKWVLYGDQLITG